MFKLTPVLKDYLWGGEKLKTMFGRKKDGIVAESWEFSVHRDGESRLADGGTFTGNIRLAVRTQDFATVYEKTIPVSVPALSSADVPNVSFAEIIRGREADCYLTYTLEDWTGEALSEAVLLFVKPKCYHYRKPRITATLRQESATTAVLHLRSNTFAHKVYVRFSGNRPEAEDQYVSITSKKGTDIRLTYPDGVTVEDLTAKFSFFSVYDIAPDCFGK